jgi:8-oxo-dGTP pyrophosphatase MutT (NUDIX family)
MKRPSPLIPGQDYIGIAIVYFCHDGQGHFVMAKRSPAACDEQDRWDIGGGGLDYGLTIIETLKKEIREEYCAKVLAYEFLGHREVHREKDGIKTHWLALDFKVLVDKDEVKNGEPHKFDEIKWFTLDNLPTNLHSQLPTFFNLYHDRLIN